jgi:SAM-dependent methyltransferase
MSEVRRGVYDALYETFKDYDAESGRLRALVETLCPDARTLLDVACGSGQHLARLALHYKVEGLDCDPEQVRAARERLGPRVEIHDGGMATFDLGRQFDVVTCLFGSIGYARTVRSLRQTIANLARHVRVGGIVIMEPWLAPEDYHPGRPYALFADLPDRKIVRMNVSRRRGTLSILDFRYMVAAPDGIETWREVHVLRLFTDAEYREAFRRTGLPILDGVGDGPTGRGLYVAVRS